MTDLEKINAYVESHRDEMLETYRKVILQESYHSAPEEVRTMGKMFKEDVRGSRFPLQADQRRNG